MAAPAQEPPWTAGVARAAAFLALVLLAAFHTVVVGGKTFASGGSVPGVLPTGPWGSRQRVPVWAFGDDAGGSAWQVASESARVGRVLREGRLPLWNPNQMCGTPLASNLQLSCWFPPRLLPLVIGAPWAWDAYTLLMLWLAGIGTWGFLRVHALGWTAAVTGGCAYMLTGFALYYASYPFLDLVATTPLLFLTLERLLVAPGRRTVAELAAAGGLTLLCGYPGPTFAVLALLAAYGLTRAWTLGDRRRLAWVAAAAALAIALASPVLGPGLRLLAEAENWRPAGIGRNTLEPAAFEGALIPSLTAHRNSPLLWNGYQGLSVCFLAVGAIAARGRGPVWFFGAVAALTLGRLVGVPPGYWLTWLPGFDRLWPRYAQLALAFACAVLAGAGVDALARTRSRWPWLVAGCVVGVGLALTAHRREYARNAEALRCFALSWAAVVPALAFGLALPGHRAIRRVLLLAVLVELTAAAQLPRCDRVEPFAPAPYVEVLRQAPERSRVLGLELVLHPPHASAFDLDDVRWMNALFSPRYARFVRDRVAPTAADRWIGVEPHQRLFGADDGLTPALDLMGVRYLLLAGDLAGWRTHQRLIRSGRHEGPAPPRQTSLTIEGRSRTVLTLHPPATLVWDEDVPAAAELRFAVALDPQVWTDERGDGVGFAVRADGEELWSAWIDPKREPRDRRWHLSAVDLARFAGKRVRLELATSPGPRGDASYDEAVWADLRLVAGGVAVAQGPLRPIYQEEVSVYENPRALPRAFVVQRVLPAGSLDEAARLLGDPTFDPRRSVVLEGVEPGELQRRGLLEGAAPRSTARLVSYGDDRIVVQVDGPGGVLVLTDTWSDLWRATVDGRPATILPADLAFRGVLFEAGPHEVVFECRDALLEACLVLAALAAASTGWLRWTGSSRR